MALVNEVIELPDTEPAMRTGLQNRVGLVAASSSSSAVYALDSYIVRFTTATRPAAAVGELGRLIRLKDPSTPEQVQVCITTTAGAYEWVTVALASS